MESTQEFLHLIDDLLLVRAVHVVIGISNPHDSGTGNSMLKCIGLGSAASSVRRKPLCPTIRIVRKEAAPIVRAHKYCEYRDRDFGVFLDTEVQRSLNGCPLSCHARIRVPSLSAEC